MVDETLYNLVAGIESRAIDAGARYWNNLPSGDQYLIPYELKDMNETFHEKIRDGMYDLEQGTCLKFIPRTNETSYINYYPG